MNNNPKIYIILPVHNRKDITLNFINCLLKQEYQNYHLILIDDGSTDGTDEMVKSKINNTTVIKGNGSLWWAGSLQKGYEWLIKNNISHDSIILIINDDTEFESDYLKNAVWFFKDIKENVMLQSICYSKQTNQLIDKGTYIDWKNFKFCQAENVEMINCLSTRGLFFRFSDFIKVGGFYPTLLPHYLSDYEFTIRAYNKGIKLMVTPNVKIWVNEDTKGYGIFGTEESIITFLKRFFSKKSMLHPLYRITFILLACPKKYWFKNIWFILKESVKMLIYNLIIKPIKFHLKKL